MTRRRKVTTPWGLGELPLTPVENKSGWESKKEFYARIERERVETAARAKAAAEAPLLAAQREYSKTLVALQKAQAENLFVVRSEELEAVCSHIPDHVEGSVEEIRTEIKNA
jgi:hypothetical protein